MIGLRIAFTGVPRQYNELRTEILDATDAVLRSGQLMNGNWTAEFENWLARRNRARYAVTVGSGTAALECMAEFYATTQPMPNPPKVLIPSMTYPATANAFMRAGWDIHFVDTDSQGLIDMRRLPDPVATSYQAVVMIGLYGAAIAHLGDHRTWRDWMIGDCLILEDAAQHWLSAECTRMGQAAAISFDPTKNLAAYGNGGAVLTSNSELMHFARAWRDNGKTDHAGTGTNSRMSEVDCAHMMIKTRHIDKWQIRRATIAKFWTDRMRNYPIRSLITNDNWSTHCYHKFVIDVDNRDRVRERLRERNIETKIHYEKPLHEISVFRQWPGPDMFSAASALARRVISLPIYPELTDLEVEYVIDQVRDCV